MKIAELRDHWRQVRTGLEEVLAKYQDADLSEIPYPGAWSISQLMLHIAFEEEVEIQYGLSRQIKEFPVEPESAVCLTMDSIRARLQAVHQLSDDYLATLTDEALDQPFEPAWGGSQPLSQWIWHTIDHEIHHRGELSLILGYLGREGLNA
jgi:uncharacterized damage-inducible protein DinB